MRYLVLAIVAIAFSMPAMPAEAGPLKKIGLVAVKSVAKVAIAPVKLLRRK